MPPSSYYTRREKRVTTLFADEYGIRKPFEVSRFVISKYLLPWTEKTTYINKYNNDCLHTDK